MKGMRLALVAVCLVGLGAVMACAPVQPARRPAVAPPEGALPPSADGIVFVRDGAAFVIRDGSLDEVAADGATKIAVGYSADRKNMLVTEERGTRRVVLVEPVGADGSETVALDTADGSTLGAVRLVGEAGPLYYSVFGDPQTSLVRAGLSPTDESSDVPLDGSFSGEFDVAATGESIVYTGAGQNPATVTLRTGTAERTLVAGAATAFSPAFSRDATRVCFTGSQQVDGEIAVWVVDSSSDRPGVVSGTEGLKPASPAFSPDGRNIAFRSSLDGAIWVVPARGGKPQKLAVTCDEAPIGW